MFFFNLACYQKGPPLLKVGLPMSIETVRIVPLLRLPPQVTNVWQVAMDTNHPNILLANRELLFLLHYNTSATFSRKPYLTCSHLHISSAALILTLIQIHLHDHLIHITLSIRL